MFSISLPFVPHTDRPLCHQGWAFTFLSLLDACFLPLVWLEVKYGMKWRLERRERLKAEKERVEERRRVKLEQKRMAP